MRKFIYKKRIVKSIYNLRCYNRASVVCALTPMEMADIRAYGVRAPIAIIPNGIDFSTPKIDQEYFDYLKNIAQNRRVVLSLSRLDPHKGIEPLIRYFNANGDKNIVLFIAGDGPETYKSHLKSLANPKNIVFLGHIDGAKKAAAYEAADIFSLLSSFEAFSLTVLEAARQKLVILASTAVFIVDQNTGIQRELQYDQIADALDYLTSCDECELRAFGQRAFEHFSQNYSLSSVIQKYDELYKYLLKMGPRPSFLHNYSNARNEP